MKHIAYGPMIKEINLRVRDTVGVAMGRVDMRRLWIVQCALMYYPMKTEIFRMGFLTAVKW